MITIIIIIYNSPTISVTIYLLCTVQNNIRELKKYIYNLLGNREMMYIMHNINSETSRDNNKQIYDSFTVYRLK